MSSILGQLANLALGLLQTLGYPGIAAVVGLESMGVPLPGETTLLAASYLAATGHLSLPLVIGSAVVGAAIGDSLGYLIGSKGGRRFLERYGKYVRVTPEKLARADGYFAHHGMKTVYFGRFIPLLRILAGPLAGASRMTYRRFLVANVAGAITWATVMGTLAYFFGKPIISILSSVGVWALIGLIVFLVLRWAIEWWLTRRRNTRLPKQPDIDLSTTDQERKKTAAPAEAKMGETGSSSAAGLPLDAFAARRSSEGGVGTLIETSWTEPPNPRYENPRGKLR